MNEEQFPLTCEYAHGGPCIDGVIRAADADFQVDEVLGFDPLGDGEHDYLHLRKQSMNTAELAKRIARLAGVKPMDVGYAGLKDRHAVTTQWFSVYRPKGDAVDWSLLEDQQVQVLRVSRHHQKLRRGQHAANQFRLKLTKCAGEFKYLEQRLQTVAEQGVPNYFGPQRFGIGAGNLGAAQALLVDRKPVRNRQLKGLYLSAARSYLFNQVLRTRVAEGSWRTLEDGDVVLTADSNYPTGPLWGRGRLASSCRIEQLENQVIERFADWCHGLEHMGLKQERRSLCLPVSDLSWHLENKDDQVVVEVAFSLPVGGYATSVIREIINYREPERFHLASRASKPL